MKVDIILIIEIQINIILFNTTQNISKNFFCWDNYFTIMSNNSNKLIHFQIAR